MGASPRRARPGYAPMATYTLLRVGSETYAVPISATVEVANLGELTAVPGARREILGVRNMHRHVLAVVDLAQVLGVHAARPPERLLVVEADGATGGFAIDDVLGIGELPEPAPGAESGFLAGTVLSDGDLIGVIDVPAVFRWLRQAAS